MAKKTIAVFGAGPGLGRGIAHRFGREGYQIALVGRRQEVIDKIAVELRNDGVDVESIVAELTDHGNVGGVVSAIEDRFGHIDAVSYSPLAANGFRPVADIDAATFQMFADLMLLTPVEIIGRVLPGMRERGHGAIVVAFGSSAVHPFPRLSGVGPILAAMRSYLHSLAPEVEGDGVYVGNLVISALIANSDLHAKMTSKEMKHPAAGKVDDGMLVVEPDELAGLVWDMVTNRDRIESYYPEEHEHWQRVVR